MQLTPQQNDAILHDGGNLQLIACAGSGKTEVVAQHTKLITPSGDGGMGFVGPGFGDGVDPVVRPRYRCFLLGNSLLDLKCPMMPLARSRLWRG